MDIQIKYKEGTNFSEEENNFIKVEVSKYGKVEVKTYTSKSGSIDFLSIFDLIFNHLDEIVSLAKFGELIRSYYKIFVKNKENKNRAYSLWFPVNDKTILVAINHSKMTDELLSHLPQALLKVFEKINLFETKICQLYPDFGIDEWRYLFIPTDEAFGNFVNLYYDLKEDKIYQVKSKQEFIKKFRLIEDDKYKLIISPFDRN